MLTKIWRNWNSWTLFVGMENGTAAMEKRRAVPQKIKNKITCDPVTPLLGIYSKEMKAESQSYLHIILNSQEVEVTVNTRQQMNGYRKCGI